MNYRWREDLSLYWEGPHGLSPPLEDWADDNTAALLASHTRHYPPHHELSWGGIFFKSERILRE
jgi:hypothetical protein